MIDYKEYRGKNRLSSPLDCQIPDHDGYTCTAWIDRNNGTIRAIEPNYVSGVYHAIPLRLRYSEGMAEPILVEPIKNMTKAKQKALDIIREHRSRKLSGLE